MAPRSPGAAAELSQIKENKRKEMKANFLSFPFICFSESGLFNGLQPIQIKKTFPYLKLNRTYFCGLLLSCRCVGGPGGDLQF
jgi:hypothetical protein